MSDYVFYPVTGDGLTQATAYTWNAGTINFDSPADWAAVTSFTTLTIGETVVSGTVPGDGANVGIIAGAIDPVAFSFYSPDPAHGDPYIATSIFPVDIVLNSGSVALGNLLLSGFNQFASVIGSTPDQFPTLDVEGAKLTVSGDILDTGEAAFPTINLGPFGSISSATATGGGTIDLGKGAEVDVAGSVAPDITFNFNDGAGNLLEIGGVSQSNTMAFAGTIEGFASGDTIFLPNVPAVANNVPTTAFFDISTGEITITVGDPSTIDISVPGFAPASGPVNLVQNGNGIDIGLICYLAGTYIATSTGETPVEHLAVGDHVRTASGQLRRIVWIGVGRVLATRGRRTAATPVIVRKGALADNVPHRDLRVTKGHSLYLDGVLIPVEFLVNHRSILWDDQAQEVALYHIELETHDVLLANGAPAESYHDDGNRWLFQNSNSGWDQPAKQVCAPVRTGGPIVDRVWRRLLDRAGPRPGMLTTDQPDLHLLVDGNRVDATSQHGLVSVFALQNRPACVRIASRAGVPAEQGLARDPRMLGVAVRRIVVRQGTRFRVIEAADPALVDGFHAYEPRNGLRWTDGDAALPAVLFDGFDGPMELLVHAGGTTQYPLCGDAAA
jgi:hypothetical protein